MKVRALVTAALLVALTAGRVQGHPRNGYGSYYITGYYPTGNLTATGSPTYYGEVAVDPCVIPLHAWVHIEGLGTFRALDTGGAVIGRHIDILVYSWNQAVAVAGPTAHRNAYWWGGWKLCRRY